MPYRSPYTHALGFVVWFIRVGGAEQVECDDILEAYAHAYDFQYIPEEQAEVVIMEILISPNLPNLVLPLVRFHEISRNGRWMEYCYRNALGKRP